MDDEARSKKMKSGLEKAPHRSLLYALGLTREEMERPLVGIVKAASEVVPGHMHLNSLAGAVKAGKADPSTSGDYASKKARALWANPEEPPWRELTGPLGLCGQPKRHGFR